MSAPHPTSDWLGVWARFRPDAEALFDATTGRRWSYPQLRDEALAWAGRLAAEGVGPGDRVSVLAYNRGETFALLFACAELGAIMAPLNWRLSEPELRYQLDNLEPAVLVTDAANAGRISGGPRRLSMEEGPGTELLKGPGSRLEDPWVVLYTSGSSGRPKGALLTHGQLHWNALNTILACDLTADDSTLTFTPLFHTGGLNCLSTPLFHRGGRVVLTGGFDAGEAIKLIQEERVSVLMGVPTIFQMMADHPDFDGADLRCVRDALCGGAALSLPLLERYLARDIPLRQGFGLTEVGPNCFSLPPTSLLSKKGSVGLPIHHVQARVVRGDGSECDPGEAGELLLRGPAVCAGYWRNPEATEESIVDGWFHTGDLLARDEDGYFYVRGRIKEMFISGGENVYPAEVEAAILDHPAVAQAAVIGVPDERWGEVGRAFVEPRPGEAVTAEALKDFLGGRLARFKLPRQIRVMAALPRTGSGKIDKQVLKKSK
jgi:fatty-acyl-CoA synthase